MTKNFLITGAAAGIGLEYTRLMLREGGKVVMTDINAELGTEQEKQLRAEFGDCQVLFVKLDVRSEAEWEEVWEKAEVWLCGPVQVLINNAGLFSRTDWKVMLDVNLKGLMVGSMLAISRMGVSAGGQGGTILNTASLAGLLTGAFNTPTEEMYTATKQAVVGFTRSLDRNNSVWRKDKVRVMAVCPWVVDTALVRAGMVNMGPEERARKEKSWVHKLMAPSEVAKAASLLLAKGSPGDVITVGPGQYFLSQLIILIFPLLDQTAYLFPNVQRMVFLMCKMIHVLLRFFGVVRPDTLLSPNLILTAAVSLVLVTFLAFHFVLSSMGF